MSFRTDHHPASRKVVRPVSSVWSRWSYRCGDGSKGRCQPGRRRGVKLERETVDCELSGVTLDRQGRGRVAAIYVSSKSSCIPFDMRVAVLISVLTECLPS
jgi:hypothetical protein